jgi:carbon storage regulator
MQRAFDNLPIIVGIAREMCKRFPRQRAAGIKPAAGCRPTAGIKPAARRRLVKNSATPVLGFAHRNGHPRPVRREIVLELFWGLRLATDGRQTGLHGMSFAHPQGDGFVLPSSFRSRRSVMLVLSRKPGQKIVIEGGITVTVIAVKGNQVRIGIDAPEDVRILRGELACWQDFSTPARTPTDDSELLPA